MNQGSPDSAILGVIIAIYAAIVISTLAVSIWMHWRILAKAGYNGALSLLVLTGIGAIVPVAVLAFAKWPLESEVEQLRAGRDRAPDAQLMTP